MSLTVQAKRYIAEHKIETGVAAALFAGLLAAMILTHAFNVSPEALKEGFSALTAKGLLMNAGLTVLVGGLFTVLYYKSRRVRQIVDNSKAISIAIKLIAAMAIVVYLLPQATFGGNMLVGGVFAGNLLGYVLISIAKEAYKRKYGQSLDERQYTFEEIVGKPLFYGDEVYKVRFREEPNSSSPAALTEPLLTTGVTATAPREIPLGDEAIEVRESPFPVIPDSLSITPVGMSDTPIGGNGSVLDVNLGASVTTKEGLSSSDEDAPKDPVALPLSNGVDFALMPEADLPIELP